MFGQIGRVVSGRGQLFIAAPAAQAAQHVKRRWQGELFTGQTGHKAAAANLPASFHQAQLPKQRSPGHPPALALGNVAKNHTVPLKQDVGQPGRQITVLGPGELVAADGRPPAGREDVG